MTMVHILFIIEFCLENLKPARLFQRFSKIPASKPASDTAFCVSTSDELYTHYRLALPITHFAQDFGSERRIEQLWFSAFGFLLFASSHKLHIDFLTLPRRIA